MTWDLIVWEARLAREARRQAVGLGGDPDDPDVIAQAAGVLYDQGLCFPPAVAAHRQASGVALPDYLTRRLPSPASPR